MSIAAPSNPREITLRGIILGILITLVFTAAHADRLLTEADAVFRTL